MRAFRLCLALAILVAADWVMTWVVLPTTGIHEVNQLVVFLGPWRHGLVYGLGLFGVTLLSSTTDDRVVRTMLITALLAFSALFAWNVTAVVLDRILA